MASLAHQPATDQIDITYLRVSSDEQRDKKTIKTQREDVHRYLEYAGMEDAVWLEDDGVSGGLAFEDRPKGAELLRLLASGRVRTVVVSKIDRLGRNALEVLRVVEAI